MAALVQNPAQFIPKLKLGFANTYTQEVATYLCTVLPLAQLNCSVFPYVLLQAYNVTREQLAPIEGTNIRHQYKGQVGCFGPPNHCQISVCAVEMFEIRPHSI